MSLLPKQPDLIGLEFCKSTIKVAALRPLRKGYEVIHLKEFPLQGKLDNLPKDSITTTALRARQVLVRPFPIQLTKEKDITSALEFQVESLLPFPLDQAVIESQIIEKKENRTLLTLFAVKKDHLKSHLQKTHLIEPEVVSSIYNALAALASLFSETSPLLLIHIGDKEVACALVRAGKLLKAHAFDRAKDFHTEIKKTLLALCPKGAETIYLIGSEDPFFVEEVKKAAESTPLYPSIPSLNLSKEKLVRYGAAIGIALCGMQSVNFRKKEFSYPHPFKRMKKPLTLFFSLSLILTAALFSLSKIALKREEKKVAYSFQSLLASQGLDLPASRADYQSELEKIEKEVLSRPDTFPLLPQVPKVRDTLAFVGELMPKETKIQNFRYHMVQRPHINSTKEKYRTLVEVEFLSPHASEAKKFHEALIAPNAFVDAKSPITWESVKGKYKTTFYLKDKTRYHG